MDLTIGTVNACGVRRKHPLVRNLLSTDKVQILSITETKLSRPLTVPGYQTFQRNCSIAGIRGVALLVENSFAATEFQLPQHLRGLECVAATVHFPNRPVIFFSYYNPPHAARISIELLHYVSSLPNAVLLGDLNARHTQFGDTINNPNGTLLVDHILSHPLWRIKNILPTFFNHIGASIIDHIICSEPLLPFFADECHLGTSITSDHLPLLVKAYFCPPPPPPPDFITRLDFKYAKWDLYATKIRDLLPAHATLSSPEDIESASATLSTSIKDAISLAIPTKRINISKRPLPNSIIEMIREKRRTYRQYLRTHDPALKTEYNRQSAKIRLSITRFTEEKWIRTTENLNYRDGKKFWHKFNALTRRKCSNPSHLEDARGNIVSSPQDKADLFQSHLQSVFQTPNHPHFDNHFRARIENETSHLFHRTPQPADLNDQDSFLAPITPEMIRARLQRSKNTSPGEDGISRLMLRHLPEEAFSFLAHIYNSCLRFSYFPLPWKSATTVMIPKPSAKPTSVSSYRPISLLSCIGKTFEQIIASRLKEFLQDNDLLPDFQFGFRSNRSTQDPLLKLQTELTKSLNTNRCALAVFLDIKQAFDSVWHAGLIHKIRQLNLPDHFTRLIGSYLSDRSVQIKVSGAMSHPFTPQAGVPQGSVIAPLLYLIYAHDSPPPAVQGITVSHFADDTAFWIARHSSTTCNKNMQTQLNRFTEWACRWRIIPNPTKTQAILFRHPDSHKFAISPANVHLTLWGERIHLQDEIVYLGVRFNKTLNWAPDLKTTLNKFRNRSNLLKALTVRLKGCKPDTLLHTYKTFVRPLIDYRAPLYSTLSNRQLNDLRAAERKIIRRIYRLNYRFPSDQLFAHTKANIDPIHTRLTTLQHKYTHRRISGNIPELTSTLLLAPGPLTRKPKRKLKYPPSRLLQLADDLPEEFEEALYNTAYSLR